MKKRKFIPALRFKFLTRFYDPLIKLTMFDELMKTFLSQADIKDDDTILDFGCGTGRLTIMAKKSAPKAAIHGIDIDPDILKIAENKVKKSSYEIFLKDYDGNCLPYENEMFDKVISSLVFHHLVRDQKVKALEEIYRVLKFGGRLYIADFGKARNIFMRGVFLVIQFYDGFATTSDNIKGLLPQLMKEVGFDEVVEHKQIITPVGPISIYSASK